jgi:NADH-quinone oxidoreductase subunit J
LDSTRLIKRILAGCVSVFAGCVFLWAVLSYPFRASGEGLVDTSMTNIGNQLMNFGDNGFVLPFEVISVLLLASMIAAIIIAKKFTND